MRRIYLLAAEADLPAAADIETQLKQRGFLVRKADPQIGFTPAMPGEITLAFWSGAMQMSAQLLNFSHRVIDAWSEGTLIFARFDHAFLPRGLSDLETIDLAFEPSRIHKVREIIERAEQIDKTSVLSLPPAPSPAPGRAAPPQKRLAPAFRIWPLALLALLSIGAIGLFVWMRMNGPLPDPGPGPHPPEPKPSMMGLGISPVYFGACAAFLLGILATGMAFRRKARSSRKATVSGGQAGRDSVSSPQKPTTPKLFISYSAKDSATVLPLASAIEASGRPIWIDKQGIASGTEWAGEIVRAIRSAERVLLMCSASAFASDHVRREVYLADKFKRPLLPIRLDGAEPPDDLVYFLVDKQWLDLSEIALGAREAHLRQALS
jgi:hypothetical protein